MKEIGVIDLMITAPHQTIIGNDFETVYVQKDKMLKS